MRIGFIGSGGIAREHLANLAVLPEVEVVALCDLSKDVIEETQRAVNARLMELGASQVLAATSFDDYRVMLRTERLDAVYICLPPFAHGAPEEAVIDAGIPMLVEKPVALDLDRAVRLLTAIRRRGLLCATGYQTRYAPHVQRAKEILTDETTVGMAMVTRFGSTPGVSWYHRQDRSGGQVTEMATHQVDLLRYLLGEVQTIYAAAATRINNQRRPDYDIFDVNCSTLTFDSGAVASFTTNFITAGDNPLSGSTMQVFCDGMSLALDSGLQVFSADGVEETTSTDNPIRTEDECFVRAVAEGRPELILSDYENGVRNLAVTLANDRSARTGQPVQIPRSEIDAALVT